MIRKIASRLLPVTALAFATALVPGAAIAAIPEMVLVSWWDEILLGAAATAGLVWLDTSSWSLMTG